MIGISTAEEAGKKMCFQEQNINHQEFFYRTSFYQPFLVFEAILLDKERTCHNFAS